MRELRELLTETRGSVLYETGVNYATRLSTKTTDEDLKKCVREFVKGLINGSIKAGISDEMVANFEMFADEKEIR